MSGTTGILALSLTAEPGEVRHNEHSHGKRLSRFRSGRTAESFEVQHKRPETFRSVEAAISVKHLRMPRTSRIVSVLTRIAAKRKLHISEPLALAEPREING